MPDISDIVVIVTDIRYGDNDEPYPITRVYRGEAFALKVIDVLHGAARNMIDNSLTQMRQ